MIITSRVGGKITKEKKKKLNFPALVGWVGGKTLLLGIGYLYLSRKRRAWYHRSSVIVGRSEKEIMA